MLRAGDFCLGKKQSYYARWHDGWSAPWRHDGAKPSKNKRYFAGTVAPKDKIRRIYGKPKNKDPAAAAAARRKSSKSKWDSLEQAKAPVPSFISLHSHSVDTSQEREETHEEWVLRRNAEFNKQLYALALVLVLV